MDPHARGNPGEGSGPPRYPGTFLVALREALAGLNWKIRRWLGVAIDCLDDQGREHTIGLENLYRRARRVPREDWPDLIAEFLASIRSARQEEELPADLGAVCKRLLVRLGRPLASPSPGLRAWSQALPGTDFVLNLVIDSPHSIAYVTEDLVANSGRNGEEWLERGLANLRERTPVDVFQRVHDESGLLLCAVADAYDSARALLLDALLPRTCRLGCFVALPCRDELLVLPVSAKSIPHLELLRVLASKSFVRDPYPISDQVFWVHAAAWRRFEIEVREDQVNVRPPEEFLPILEQLSKGPEREDEPGPLPP